MNESVWSRFLEINIGDDNQSEGNIVNRSFKVNGPSITDIGSYEIRLGRNLVDYPDKLIEDCHFNLDIIRKAEEET